MKSRLMRRLLLYFTVALLAFTLAVGVLFGFFFLRHSKEHHLAELRSLALALTEAVEQGEAYSLAVAEQAAPAIENEAGHPHRMRHGRRDAAFDAPPANHAGYCRRTFNASTADSSDADGLSGAAVGRWLLELNKLSQGEVWLVDAATRTVSLYGEENTARYDDFPPAAEAMLQNVWNGETLSSEEFTPLLEAPSVTVGTPLRDREGNVVGALLMHRKLTGLYAVQKEALVLFGACLVGALLVAFLLSWLLARRFIKPLKHLELFAGELAAENYHLRSGIAQADEIGSLAGSLDMLAVRLEDTREEKARLEKLRQDFLAGVSHELKTPVTVLRGILELLASGMVKDEGKRQDYLGRMMDNVLVLQRLIQDLFELARLQNADFTIEKAPLNILDPLHDAVKSVQQLADKRNIKLSATESTASLLFSGDYGRLRQLFLALLDNAVKFSPDGGEICVAVEGDATDWRIFIKDYGCGIPADELPYIFDRFHSKRNERNKGGTGLGLPIAREIARRHNLELSCESTEGEGACFVLTKLS